MQKGTLLFICSEAGKFPLKKYTLYFSCFTFLFFSKGNAQSPQDCINAITVCNNVYVQTTTFSGFGNTQEITSGGNTCLGNGETNSSWYLFKIKNPGSLTIDISPVNALDDYDFVIYNLTGDSCQSISLGNNLPVRCNYSSTAGNTGLANGYVQASVNSSGPPFCAPLNVASGETYVMMINNFTSSSFGYTLTFGGTATIYDTEFPVLDSVDVFDCGPNKVDLYFSENIDPASITGLGTEFTVTGPSGVVVKDAALYTSNNIVRVRFFLPITVPGSYTITIQQGADGNTVSDNCNNFVLGNTSVSFNVLFQSPVVTIGSLQPASCNIDNGSATANVVGGTAPFTYLWNTSPVQTGVTATNLAPGHYTVTVTDVNGCTSLDNCNILITGQPQLTITSVNDTCPNPGSGQASVAVAGGTPQYSYLWSTIPPQTTATITGLTEGVYTVTVTDAAGCTSTAAINIQLKGKPLISFTQQNPICDGSVLGIATANVAGFAPFSYLWSTNPVQTTQTISSLTPGSYTVTVTDASGCIDSAVVVIANNQMNITATVTDVICGNQPTGIISLVVTGAIPPLTYKWNTTPPQTTQNAINLGIGTYKAVVTDQTGCKDSITASVGGPPPIVLSVVTNDAGCTLNNGNASVAVSGGISPYTYYWNTPVVQFTPVAVNLPAGAFSVTVTDNIGCTETNYAYVSNFNGPSGTISSVTDATCNLPNGSATATVNIGASPFIFAWNTVPAQLNATATNLAPDEYTVQITDANGCISFLNVKINAVGMVDALPGASTNAACGQPTGSATVIDTGGVGPYSYLWLTSPSQTTATAINLLAGNYSAVVIDGNGCKDTAVVTIGENPANSSISNSMACLNETTFFTGTTDYPGAVTWQWNFGDPLNPNATSTLQNPSYNYPVPGSYTATIYINGGCATDTITKQVTAGVKPDASFLTDSQPLLAEADITFIYTGTPVLQYEWNFGNNVFFYAESPIHVYSHSDSVSVELIVTDQYGCLDTVVNKYFVEDAPQIFIPGSFSPNSDDRNDVFKVYSRGLLDCNVQIFNRWGQKVFHSDDKNIILNTGWNGSYQGKKVPQGVYAYVITGTLLNKKPFNLNGKVTIIR